ncbi:hypothetical protein H2204_010098 [Knufia peltigerae]|uniref:Carbonic anhydrase n=1 Tax=Knufia peltigerae TaxID=1002370 RepID=A0AA39CVA3_9EURO|nr:hypothetical protein H2204_010098 [Knufia peltigerae]
MPAKQELGRSAAEVAITYDFVKANEEYLNEGHKPEPSDLTRGPRSYTAVITCIDSRATPEHWYDLRPNEVWSLRNGGGRANDPGLLRSLMILQATSEVKEIRVLHHKNCGSLYYNNQWVHGLVQKNSPSRSGQYSPSAYPHCQSMGTLPFIRRGDKDEKEIIIDSIKQDVEFLRSHPLVKESVKVTGFYQDLSNGLISEVDVP